MLKKVNGKTVEENVPSGAVFTDTVTTVNGNTGAIVKADITALGIPAQDTVYVHPNHSGDVTSVADGATTITNKVVTLAKMADLPTKTLLGRATTGTGAPEVLSIGTGFTVDASSIKVNVLDMLTASDTDKALSANQGRILKGLVDLKAPLANVESGWLAILATLTYASADSPTFVVNTSTDLTSKISVGMKLKLTQSTVKGIFIVNSYNINHYHIIWWYRLIP